MNSESRSLKLFGLANIPVPGLIAGVPKVSITRDCDSEIVQNKVSDKTTKSNLFSECYAFSAQGIRHHDLDIRTGQFVVSHPPFCFTGIRAKNLLPGFCSTTASHPTKRAMKARHGWVPIAGARAASVLVPAGRAAETLTSTRLSNRELVAASCAQTIKTPWATSSRTQFCFDLSRSSNTSDCIGLALYPFRRVWHVMATMYRLLAGQHHAAAFDCAGMFGTWHSPILSQ